MMTKKRVTELEDRTEVGTDTVKIVIHKDKCIEVADKAINMLRAGKFPFDKAEKVRPEAILPKGMEQGSLDHAIYLFCSVGLDASKKAEHLYKGARAIFEEVGAQRFLKLQKSELTSLVDKHMGLGETGTGGYDEPVKVFSVIFQ
jgi:hypothetical protein